MTGIDADACGKGQRGIRGDIFDEINSGKVVGVRGFGESTHSRGRCWFAVAPVLYSSSFDSRLESG